MNPFNHTHVVVIEQEGAFTWPVGTMVKLVFTGAGGISYYKDALGNVRLLWDSEVLKGQS